MAEQLQANLVLPRLPNYQVVRFKAHHGLWSIGAVFSGLSNPMSQFCRKERWTLVACLQSASCECLCRRGKVKMLQKRWEVLKWGLTFVPDLQKNWHVFLQFQGKRSKVSWEAFQEMSMSLPFLLCRGPNTFVHLSLYFIALSLHKCKETIS